MASGFSNLTWSDHPRLFPNFPNFWSFNILWSANYDALYCDLSNTVRFRIRCMASDAKRWADFDMLRWALNRCGHMERIMMIRWRYLGSGHARVARHWKSVQQHRGVVQIRKMNTQWGGRKEYGECIWLYATLFWREVGILLDAAVSVLLVESASVRRQRLTRPGLVEV